jgi:hypothetical protein
VTYTNHALNQFLGHVKNYTQKIVRVGGKVDDEDIAKFGFREQLFEVGDRRHYGRLRREVEESKKKIAKIQKAFSALSRGFINNFIDE